MASSAAMDDRGRVTIDRRYRARLAGPLVQILTSRGVLLAPQATRVEGIERLPPVHEIEVESSAAEEAG